MRLIAPLAEKSTATKKCHVDSTKALTFENSTISALSVFRFSSSVDKLLIGFGTISAIGTGICVPLLTIYLANITQSLINGGLSDSEIIQLMCNNRTSDGGFSQRKDHKVIETVAVSTLYVVLVATLSFICNFSHVSCFNAAAENQTHRMKSAFFKAMLHQEIAWHEKQKSTSYITRFSEDIWKIQEGIGEKVGLFIVAISTFICTITCAFIHGWKFTLVMVGVAPMTSITIGLLAKVQVKLSGVELKAKAECGAIAQEVFGAIRTVFAFGGQRKEIDRFRLHSDAAQRAAVKCGAVTACISAVAQSFQYFIFALGLWYGAGLVADICQQNEYTSLDILVIFFCVLGGTSKISGITPYLENFTRARCSAAFVFSVLDQSPTIDSSSVGGKVPQTMQGHVSFNNVHFKYPSRPDQNVLKGVSFDVPPQKTVAFVGPSGSGKSTCAQLILRFYDAQSGSITIDGHPLPELNLKWLRSQIGIVSQEPVLFAGSISENIRYGRLDVTQEEIEAAAKESNAEEFISRLENKYDTVVGERGARLSGGQKQRIAIARALVRNPKILILDEATSALDNQSESLVQQALERARQKRTVIIIAHRLPTIRNADVIIVFKDGVVIEAGNHKALMAQRGAYYCMIASHNVKRKNSMKQTNGSLQSSIDEKSFPLNGTNRSLEKHDNRQHQKTISTKGINGAKIAQAIDSHHYKPRWFDVLKLQNTRELTCLIGGTIASAFVGISVIFLSYLLGNVLNVFVPSLGHDGTPSRDEVALKYCYVFLASGAFFAGAAFFESLLFTMAGESLIDRLRSAAFTAVIQKSVAWFDCEENKVGAVCSRIFSDTALVQGGTGLRMGLVVQAITTTTGCLILSFYNNWKLGMLAVGIAPAMGLVIYFQSKLVNAMTNIQNERTAEALALEAITNLRTVASFGLEQTFHEAYVKSIEKSHRLIIRNTWKRGIIYSLSSCLPQYTYASSLFYGSTMMIDGLAFNSVVSVSHALRYGMQAISNALEFTPNFLEAKLASDRVLTLLNQSQPQHTKSLYSNAELIGFKRPAIDYDQVDFENVSFRYPTQSTQALQQLSLVVKAGKTTALVGSSGSGKSTLIQLILRFYDPDSGCIKLDKSTDARELSITSLRSKLSFVSQEPVLFDKTIKENIKYGDNTRQVQMAEIIDAAKLANIHSFVQSLPLGYDTVVGSGQLSGGEKQRIAIARAMVRDPKILLLDEATSALDNESEKVVQLALDAARKGRTCITVAHRLSTVRNADNIVVLNKGKLHEQGTHEELSRLGGMFVKFLSADLEDSCES